MFQVKIRSEIGPEEALDLTGAEVLSESVVGVGSVDEGED